MGNSNKYKLMDETCKNEKSLYSFDLYLYSFNVNTKLKNSKTLTIFKKYPCKLKFYPNFIRIKKDKDILYEYSYYDIASWGHGKNIFVLTTTKNQKIIFKQVEDSSKCAKCLDEICQYILKKNHRDTTNVLE